MNEAQLREEICRIGSSLYARGCVHGSAGNISVRLPADAGYLITPTDACLGLLDPGALAHVNEAGTQIGGAAASKTLLLHRQVYDADPAVHCVLHTHATELVALSLAGVWRNDAVLPPITPYQVMKIGRVPLIPYHLPGDPAVAGQVAQAVHTARAAGAPIRGVLCERLGPVVWHSSPAAAMAALEELEETARLWRLARPLPLSGAQIDALCARFGVHWDVAARVAAAANV